jgi:hypothetical protein
MDTTRFDLLVRSLASGSSRRAILGQTIVATLGLGGGFVSRSTHGKSRKKKLARNAFGCVDVGKPCRGKDSACCSGVCQGKKPKKGKKDKSRCVAHDTRGCREFDDSCGPGDTFCTTSSGYEFAKCFHTTGNAGYCAQGVACVPCTRDTDCIDACGAGAACVICPDGCPGSETMCVGVTACN